MKEIGDNYTKAFFEWFLNYEDVNRWLLIGWGKKSFLCESAKEILKLLSISEFLNITKARSNLDIYTNTNETEMDVSPLDAVLKLHCVF